MRQALDKTEDIENFGSILEAGSLRTEATRRGYVEAMAEFKDDAKVEPDAVSPEVLDQKVVNYMNTQFLQGVRAWKGERLLAALMCLFPSYSRFGSRRLPRTLRALRGWRLLSPSYSREPWDWLVWCALAMALISAGRFLAAIATLVMVEAYLRPGEMLSLEPASLLPPRAGREDWALLLFPQHRPERSKAGASDDTVMMDSRGTRGLRSVLAALSRSGRKKVFPFTYAEYAQWFGEAAAQIKVSLVPYQGRHSGASLDRSSNYRSLPDVKKRGRWSSNKSVQRYEKTGRLQKTWRELSARQKAHFLRCEKLLADVVVHGMAPLAVPPV